VIIAIIKQLNKEFGLSAMKCYTEDLSERSVNKITIDSTPIHNFTKKKYFCDTKQNQIQGKMDFAYKPLRSFLSAYSATRVLCYVIWIPKISEYGYFIKSLLF
jgi:hypothetical protein